MTAYNLTPTATLPSLQAQHKKEQRRKVLAEVRERRKIIYANFYKKMRLQPDNALDTIS